MSKRSSCKFGLLENIGFLSPADCVYSCKKNGCKVTEQDCDGCPDYKSRYIEFPIEVDKIVYGEEDKGYNSRNCGRLVKVRHCDSEKTYLGIHLGDLPVSTYVTYKDRELKVSQMINPAIFVPELSRVVYGCESWWGFIDSMDELSDITDEDIQSQWYVKLLQDYICKGEKKDEV